MCVNHDQSTMYRVQRTNGLTDQGPLACDGVTGLPKALAGAEAEPLSEQREGTNG